MSARSDSSKPVGRIAIIDIARGTALLAMAIYHFAWDLEFFGYASPGMTADVGWRLFARLIAGSFLFLVGFSLVLAHGRGIRWRPFAKRLAMVCAAALAITVVTRFATPDRFIFFGILHCIAVSSVVGLVFLHLPATVTGLSGIAVIVVAPHLAAPFFDHPALLWLGLATGPVQSNDYVPLFPWFGPVLLGMAAAQFAGGTGVLARLAALRPGSGILPSGLDFAGRHSLAVYLIHQPVLVAAISLFSLIAPPEQVDPAALFLSSCNRSCVQTNEAGFCDHFCACTLRRLTEETLLDAMMSEGTEALSKPEIQAVIQGCTADFFTLPPSE